MSDRILLVDDHEVLLEGIRTLVERSGRQWEICGMAHDGQEGVEMVRALKPDIVILDISMPVMNGIEAARAITSENGKSKILLFTMHDSDRIEKEAREAGARGVVVKSQAARSLIRAIDAVLAGGTFFGSESDGDSSAVSPQKRKPGMGGPLFLAALSF
ncbi:MAG: response regulator transcription factor [Candidatus Acidiferrales bacterium]